MNLCSSSRDARRRSPRRLSPGPETIFAASLLGILFVARAAATPPPEATTPAQGDGAICFASFEVRPPGSTPPLSTTTWAPSAGSRFAFSVAGLPRETLAAGESLFVEGLTTDRKTRVRVELDGKPYETFSLDLGASPGHRTCLWLYPGYWHWIDVGWKGSGGCRCAPFAPDLRPKAWHVSPSADPRSSTSYPMVKWSVVARLEAGMSRARAEEILGRAFETYHHPVNAIVFSTAPDGSPVEVALRLAPDGAIEELSFKRAD